MATVGILGGDQSETTSLLLRICQENGLSALSSLCKITENYLIPVVCIYGKELSYPKVWIIQEETDYNFHLTTNVKDGSYLIVNADKPVSVPFGCGGIITYGFNGKASVTASSVADGALQVCIQRGFVTLGQRFYEPQEFKTSCPASANPINLLSAVTACAVCDVFAQNDF